MIDIILSCNNSNGIGLNGNIPWHCKDDLSLFKKMTLGHILIVGRKTAETLPELSNRTIIVISKREIQFKNFRVFNSVYDAVFFCQERFPSKKIFIGGGSEIYNYVLVHMINFIDNIYISKIDNNMECDRFVKLDPNIWEKNTETKYASFIFEKWNRIIFEETQYLDILKEVLKNGKDRNTRNGKTKSLFCKSLKFNLQKGFPLITTKKMFFRGIVEELLFFIKGETDSKKLETNGVNIWKKNTDREFLDKNGFNDRNEGIMGPLYGFQWRNFNADYCEKTGKAISKGLDQLKETIDLIKKDPNSRRIILTDYNPIQAKSGVLYPCHSIIIQFYIEDGFLDMFCFNRSQDLFLGTPFNIASSALFLTLISEITSLKPRYLNMSLGDVHIYESHFQAVSSQIERKPYKFPNLKINKKITDLQDIENLQFTDIALESYFSHNSIQAEMIA